MTRTRFYRHPDPAQRVVHDQARGAARQLVRAGEIVWAQPGPGLPVGFALLARRAADFTTREVVRVDDVYGVEMLIALHQLKAVGELAINADTREVKLRA